MSFLKDNIFAVAIACLAILLYVYIKKKFSYFSDRGFEYVSSSILQFFKSVSLGELIERPARIYNQEYDGEKAYIGFYQFFKPFLLVMDPSMVETVLIKDFSHFNDHGLELDIKNNPLMGHLFNMNGDNWRTLRHKLVPTFTSGKLKGMIPTMQECADSLIESIKQDATLRNETNLKDLYKRYSMAVIARCAFGIDPESIQDPNSQFRRIMARVFAPKLINQIKISFVFTLPTLSRWLNIKLFDQEVEDFFLGLMRQSFEMRKKPGMRRNDFIQLLMELKEKGSVEVDTKDLEQDEKESLASLQSQPPSAKLELTEELLMAQVFVFIVGGFENNAFLVAMMHYVLSKHPEIQAKVRDEVREIKAKYGEINYQSLRDMKLLSACVDEALRFYTPVPSLLRECTKTFTLRDGKTIEKGLGISIPVKALHSDSRYWPDPEQFNPDRFLNGEVVPGTYMPFGDGPRICIAQRLALIVGKLMVAKLVENFELLPSPKTKEPIKLTVTTNADFVGGVWGSLKPL